MSAMTIDEQIAYLTKKADAAQKSGNYDAMREYDEQIKRLQDEKWKMFQKISDEPNGKPKTR